ncbi:bifunctional arginine demethylase and lysyl-hydroxylase psr-1-like [Musca vetustissima]|uniref:bifunctional arginine demethylase and lysyl-hydroxylase psr-1-like n=1 Tax=Musca vetustissima TaxID=27455 RepID=UPI002AB7167E|nr:bifunctional arginine demethylase and lysyl-hydroxylase psr-1-like [Musca vetustissima]
MECARKKLEDIVAKCHTENIDVLKIESINKFLLENKKSSSHKEKWLKFLLVTSLLTYAINYYFTELQSKRCTFQMPNLMRYAFRPPESCTFCENVDQIERVSNITPQEFERKYAYSAKPVIVGDATKNWTALEKFNYWYFHDVYNNAQRKEKILDCQFLPYKTGFRDIFEALDMPESRVEYFQSNDVQGDVQKPWYFGWSNCNPETAEEFRRHYGRPYFLPETSENNNVDWFFIGTAGLGAHMHIDNVRLPSWQAQLSGSKRWLLAPPPECYFKCKSFDAIVNKGDIIVLDTNKWYHQTFVQPGEISLTIGAEYD